MEIVENGNGEHKSEMNGENGVDGRTLEAESVAQEKKEFEKEMEEQKYARLQYLLEKTTLYSQFLSQKVVDAKKIVEDHAPIEKPKENGNAQKRKRLEEETEEDLQPSPKKGKASPQPGYHPPPIITAQLRPYQLLGVEWLISLWENGLNGILADEMGLGKTLQCITFFAHLVNKGVLGPYLVVAPLSTLGNWVREVKRWAPSLDCLMYHGSKEEREEIRKVRFKRNPKVPLCIVVTSYEIAMNDRKFFQKIQWKYLVVDEGHRLKNFNCRLLRDLKTLFSANRLLLTGTPLQNNLSELWSLLNFLLPDIFDDLSSFESWFDFSEINDKEASQSILRKQQESQVVSKLHSILRPFLLRRVKTDVELDLPSKREKIVHTRLTEKQLMYYRAILDKTLPSILSASAFQQMKNKGTGLKNRLMQLRKCCGHPFLFEWPTNKKVLFTVFCSVLLGRGYCGWNYYFFFWQGPDLGSSPSSIAKRRKKSFDLQSIYEDVGYFRGLFGVQRLFLFSY